MYQATGSRFSASTIIGCYHLVMRPIGCFLLLLLFAPFAVAGDAVIADFETGSAPAASQAITPHISSDAPAQGRSFLQLSIADDAKGAYVRIALPAGVDVSTHEKVVAMLRSPQAVNMRWLALDEGGKPIFQRRFELPGGEKWIHLEEPLRLWRWDNQRVGDWDEVRELALRVDSPARQVDLDDLRLVGEANGETHIRWLLDVAFENRPRKFVSNAGLLVATDAVDGFTDADLRRLLDDMAHARAFIRRIFADTVRPTDDAGPITLLIFSSDDDHRAFWDRLEKQWRVQIAPPDQGYTVQDISGATYDKRLGVRRPVYLHESAHGIVARDLRLLVSHPPHRPLQEGLANYLQLCVHPQSIDRNDYVRNFAGDVDPSGEKFFKPLQMLFEGTVTTRNYAQLASVVAYLVENDVPLLRNLAAGLAEGQSASQILETRGVTWQKFEDAWLAWGRRQFSGEKSRAIGDAVFDTPVEFR